MVLRRDSPIRIIIGTVSGFGVLGSRCFQAWIELAGHRNFIQSSAVPGRDLLAVKIIATNTDPSDMIIESGG
jgi:hypothetical protein